MCCGNLVGKIGRRRVFDYAPLDTDDHPLRWQVVQNEHHLVETDGLAGVDFSLVDVFAVVAIINVRSIYFISLFVE